MLFSSLIKTRWIQAVNILALFKCYSAKALWSTENSVKLHFVPGHILNKHAWHSFCHVPEGPALRTLQRRCTWENTWHGFVVERHGRPATGCLSTGIEIQLVLSLIDQKKFWVFRLIISRLRGSSWMDLIGPNKATEKNIKFEEFKND